MQGPMSLTRAPLEIFLELNGTLNQSNFAPTIGPVSYVVWAGGCQAQGSTHGNCSEACKNSLWIWSSTTALSSCYGARLIARCISSYQIDPTIVDQAKDLGISTENISSNGLFYPDVELRVVQCLQSYCASASCANACATEKLDSDGNYSDGLESCYEAMCSTISLAVNADIGGIGVRISHPS